MVSIDIALNEDWRQNQWECFFFRDPAVSELFYFKYDVEAFNVTIYIGNSDVDSISDAIPVLT